MKKIILTGAILASSFIITPAALSWGCGPGVKCPTTTTTSTTTTQSTTTTSSTSTTVPETTTTTTSTTIPEITTTTIEKPHKPIKFTG